MDIIFEYGLIKIVQHITNDLFNIKPVLILIIIEKWIFILIIIGKLILFDN